MRRKGRVAIALPAWALAAGAASTRQAVRERVEMSLPVTGTIDIAADARARGHVVDQPDKLPWCANGLPARCRSGGSRR